MSIYNCLSNYPAGVSDADFKDAEPLICGICDAEVDELDRHDTCAECNRVVDELPCDELADE